MGERREARRRHTAILSDVHLSQHHPEDATDPLWMRYRLGRYAPDQEVCGLLDGLLERFAGDELEVVFNGDLFDFDAPWVKDGQSSFDEFTLDEEGCAGQMARMLADHPEFLAAVARVLRAGHRVLITSGNHDIELYWPMVRELIYAAVNRHAGLPEPTLRERLRFRAWFHLTEDGIYIEHGSQYDAFNRVRQPMIPLNAKGDRIHVQFGKQMFKRIGSRLGYLNPYYEESFYIGLHNFLPVFSRFALTRHSMLMPYVHGCWTVMRDLWRERHALGRVEEGLALALQETGATKEQIQATLALNPEPAESHFVHIVRQTWWDRFLLILLTLGSVGWGVFSDWVTGLVGGAATLGLFGLYEWRYPKPDLRTFDAPPPGIVELFDIHQSWAICMGHTHRCFGRWEDGRFHGNSGTWAPGYLDRHCTRPVFDGRPLLLLTTEREAAGLGWDRSTAAGGLHWWRNGDWVAEPGATRDAPTAPSSPVARALTRRDSAP
jgi:UDP-2,3-diacylglucosamine pyrophosphatase LpxH